MLAKNVPFLRVTLVSLLESIGTTLAYRLAHSVHYGEPIDVSVDPNCYTCPYTLRDDLQALSLVSKNPWAYDTDPDLRKRAALSMFLSCEDLCRETNDNLCFRMASFDPSTVQIIDYARFICAKILGPFVLDTLDFSPGANTGIKGVNVNIIDKLTYYPVCTPKAYTTVMWNVLHFLPLYSISCGLITRTRTSVSLNVELPLVKGNSFTTVPKDWKKDRPICIEPLGNMLVQKGIGSAIRNRLKRFGLDINTAQTLHGELARSGSIDDSLSTIDLKSASDTIAYELVRLILPKSWFRQLDAVRSKFTNIGSESDPNWIENEKFSSMGNGYTFELETLIFYCLCLGVRRYHGHNSMVVRVYGDDIIVDSRIGERVTSTLKEVGFLINNEKTFLSGPFKESCGYDYFNGLDVRPVYFTAPVPRSDQRGDEWLAFFYGFCNRIHEIASHLSDHPDFLDSRFKSVWLSVLAKIPRGKQCFGPSHLGDSVLMGSSWSLRELPVDSQERRDVLMRNHSVIRTTVCPHLRVMVRRGAKRKLGVAHDHLLACILAGVSPDGVEVRSSAYSFRPTWVTIWGVNHAKAVPSFVKRIRHTGKTWL